MRNLIPILLPVATATYAWFVYGYKYPTFFIGKLITIAAFLFFPLAIILFIALRFRGSTRRSRASQ